MVGIELKYLSQWHSDHFATDTVAVVPLLLGMKKKGVRTKLLPYTNFNIEVYATQKKLIA